VKHAIFFLKVFIISCFIQQLCAKEAQEQNAEMFVLVHGTIKPAEFSFSSVMKIMRDKVDNTLYSLAASYIRQDPTFYNVQAMQERGLVKIDITPQSRRSNAAHIVGSMYDLQLEQLDKKFETNLYYTLGWNGLLSDSKRYEEAEFFHEELNKELERLAQKEIYPSITVIAYSHGANVVLYLPAARDNNPSFQEKPFIIDKLVLLAAPIQKETDYFSADPLFKAIYNIYSTEDNIQILDLFSSQQFFSKRKFTQRRGFKVPKKIRQIRMRVTKDIKWRHKAKELNAPHEILTYPGIKLVHKDPGHTEMWNFQWGAYWYRDSFPLKPLPVMTIIPTILDAVDKHPDQKHLTFDYAPTENGLLLQNKKTRFKKAFAFMTSEKQKSLWQLALDYKPENSSIEAQQRQVALALKKAQENLLKTHQYKKPHNKALAHYMKQISLGTFDTVPGAMKMGKMRLARTSW
jgi:hypothetical protein